MPVPPDKIHHVAGTILAQVRRGDAIIKNFNTFAHSIDEDVKEVNLADVVELASALSRRFAANKNVTLTLGDMTSAAIRTAPYSLMHFLQLCIDRGLAAAGSGDVLTLALGPSGDGVELTISGMGPEATPPDSADAQGTGPRPGSGRFPGFRHRNPARPPSQKTPRGPGIDANPIQPSMRRTNMSEKILLIDDETEFLSNLSERMSLRGMEPSTADNAKTAMAAIKEGNYDAIVLDLQMPDMDGIDILRFIRETRPEMQVILLTGHATVEKGIKAMKLGAMDFLEKPADINVLTDKIKKAQAKKMLLVERETEGKIKGHSRTQRLVGSSPFLNTATAGLSSPGSGRSRGMKILNLLR